MENQWSEDFGEMNWKGAMTKAANLGMRLPTRAEIRAAYTVGETKSWKAESYWTSDECSEVTAYFFFVDNGDVHLDSKDSFNNVRCIR